MLTEVIHEFLRDFHCDGIRAVVIVAVRNILAFTLEVHGQAAFVTNHLHLAIADGSQRVGHDGQTGNTGSTDTLHVTVVQSHFVCLIVILVVHIVDNLQGIHVHLGQPTHHLLVFLHHLVIVEIFARNRLELGSHLHTGTLVAPAVDGIKQALGQIGTSTEELHLLADFHRRHTAGNAIVVTVIHTHQVVVLILDGRSVDRNLGTELLPVLRQFVRPQHRQVRLRSRPEVVERMQVTEASLRHQRAAVDAHSAQRFRHPYRGAGKQVVIFGRTQEPYDTQFDDHLVHQFLCFLLRQFSFADVFLYINVEESRSTPYGHGRTVLVLHSGQISQIYELHGFAGILGRTGHIEPVCGTHLLKIL